jgi:hypothetical protein
MVALLLCGFWGVGVVTVASSNGAHMKVLGPAGAAGLAMLLWLNLGSLLVIRPFLRGHPTAWAAVVGVLFFLLVGDLAGLAGQTYRAVSTNTGGLNFIQPLIRLSLEGALLARLFSARNWFGVEVHQGWREMWVRGWWAMVVTGALELTYLYLAQTTG